MGRLGSVALRLRTPVVNAWPCAHSRGTVSPQKTLSCAEITIFLTDPTGITPSIQKLPRNKEDLQAVFSLNKPLTDDERHAYNGLRLTAYGLRLTAYGLRLTAYGLRLTAYGLILAWNSLTLQDSHNRFFPERLTTRTNLSVRMKSCPHSGIYPSAQNTKENQ